MVYNNARKYTMSHRLRTMLLEVFLARGQTNFLHEYMHKSV